MFEKYFLTNFDHKISYKYLAEEDLANPNIDYEVRIDEFERDGKRYCRKQLVKITRTLKMVAN